MILEYIRENKKSFPKYFKIRELKMYHEKNMLYPIWDNMKIVGFFVLDKTMFKSLYINKEYRNNSKDYLKKIFTYIKSVRRELTIAVNEKSKRVVKLCEKNDFIKTNEIVKGKYHDLVVYKWTTF